MPFRRSVISNQPLDVPALHGDSTASISSSAPTGPDDRGMRKMGGSMRSLRGGSQSGIRRGAGVRWLLALTFVFSSVAALVPVASAGAEDIAFDGVWATTDAAV